MKETAKIFKAISDNTRLRILKMLEMRPLCVCEIQYAIKGSQPNVSHHLKTLSDAGLVEFRRDGLWIAYRIAHAPESSLQAAVLALVRGSLGEDSLVAGDRVVLKGVDRVSVSLKK